MWVLLIGAGLALAGVLVTRGSPRRLLRSLQSRWMLVAAAALLAGIGLVDLHEDRYDTVGFGVVLLAYVFVLAFCLRNLRTRGMGIVTIGVAMNAVAIGLNQGMPIDAGGRTIEPSVFHRPEKDGDLLPFLGEIVPLPEPFDEMVSFGDLVIGVGMIDAAYHAGRPARRPTTVAREPVSTR